MWWLPVELRIKTSQSELCLHKHYLSTWYFMCSRDTSDTFQCTCCAPPALCSQCVKFRIPNLNWSFTCIFGLRRDCKFCLARIFLNDHVYSSRFDVYRLNNRCLAFSSRSRTSELPSRGTIMRSPLHPPRPHYPDISAALLK